MAMFVTGAGTWAPHAGSDRAGDDHGSCQGDAA
jgi:hypothetical protein